MLRLVWPSMTALAVSLVWTATLASPKGAVATNSRCSGAAAMDLRNAFAARTGCPSFTWSLPVEQRIGLLTQAPGNLTVCVSGKRGGNAQLLRPVISEAQRCIEVICRLLIFAHMDGHRPEISTYIRPPAAVPLALSVLQTLQQVV